MAKNQQKSTTTRTLQELDLSENEATLYAQMLNHPQSTVRELGTRAPYPRTMLYYVLNQLIQRGLVTTKKQGSRTAYVAEDPERLYDLLSNKEREFERHSGAVRELIPEMKKQYRLAGRRPNVRMFEGIEEYQKALEDLILSKPKEIYAYETLEKKRSAIQTRDSHETRRITHKILKKVLFFENADALKTLAGRKYDDFTQFRAIKRDVASFDADLTLYDGKLLYTSYYDEHEPTAVLVEDRALYEMQKKIFEALWKEAKDHTLASFPKL